jgi:hypothetical protein
MKYLFIATIALVLLVQIGCKKTDHNGPCVGQYSGNMHVIKDCTGSYLRHQSIDYKICNASAVAGYKNGDLVNASFNKISSCNSFPGYICQLYHENEGFITVLCITKPVFGPH